MAWSGDAMTKADQVRLTTWRFKVLQQAEERARNVAQTAGRRAPLSPLAAAHGIVFFAWLILFLVQSRLIATRHVALHRKLGLASVFVLALMVPLAYMATVAMVRRGFDLSGDLGI